MRSGYDQTDTAISSELLLAMVVPTKLYSPSSSFHTPSLRCRYIALPSVLTLYWNVQCLEIFNTQEHLYRTKASNVVTPDSFVCVLRGYISP